MSASLPLIANQLELEIIFNIQPGPNLWPLSLVRGHRGMWGLITDPAKCLAARPGHLSWPHVCPLPHDIRPVTPFIAGIDVEDIRKDGQDKNFLTDSKFSLRLDILQNCYALERASALARFFSVRSSKRARARRGSTFFSRSRLFYCKFFK